MVFLCLTFQETAKVSSTGDASFYSPTSNAEGFHVLVNTCLPLVMLVGVKKSHYGFDFNFPND